MQHSAHALKKKTWLDSLEETLIVLILGLMTLITFTNVVLRKGFNDSLIWGQEATGMLFAWLVILGVSYCFKITSHLGIDILVNSLRPSLRKIVGLLAALATLSYALLLLKGSWDYYANFVGLPATTGHWFPTGFEHNFINRSFYEVDQIYMPSFLNFLGTWLNDGEPYEKLPRFIPYFVLPFGSLLLLFRISQATWLLMTGKIDKLIAGHEAEDDLKALTEQDTK